jgi:hypothetical protein
MTLEELRKNFLVKEKPPTKEDFESGKCFLAEPFIEKDKRVFWIWFENYEEYKKYEYLESPSDYKTKEKLFGVLVEKGYAYITKKGTPSRIQLVLPEKWEIKDKNIKRSLSVVLQGIDEDNDRLLHDLYTKARGKKGE